MSKQSLADRTCLTCACFARYNREGKEVERNDLTCKPVCMRGPPAFIQVPIEVEVPVMTKDGQPFVDRHGQGRTQVQVVQQLQAFFRPTDPGARCWEWVPEGTLPGDVPRGRDSGAL